MEISKSAYLPPFKDLEHSIEEGSVEARANLKYLSVLEGPCKLLNSSTVEEIPQQLPHVLNCVRCDSFLKS